MKCVLVPVDGSPEVQEIHGEAFRHLVHHFPDGFDGIRLGNGVIGYVGDCSLVDGSPANVRGLAVTDACYRKAAGRDYHADVRGPMVILGVTRGGSEKSVPDNFIAEHFPTLAEG